MAPADVVAFCELGQSGDKFIAFVEYQRERFLLALPQLLEFHEPAPLQNLSPKHGSDRGAISNGGSTLRHAPMRAFVRHECDFS
jgi:hypothetical protein